MMPSPALRQQNSSILFFYHQEQTKPDGFWRPSPYACTTYPTGPEQRPSARPFALVSSPARVWDWRSGWIPTPGHESGTKWWRGRSTLAMTPTWAIFWKSLAKMISGSISEFRCGISRWRRTWPSRNPDIPQISHSRKWRDKRKTIINSSAKRCVTDTGQLKD